MDADPKSTIQDGRSSAFHAASCSALRVLPISGQEAKPWILERHYAKRMPMIEHCFGLFNGSECVGVCSFGDGSGNINNNSLGQYKMNELNRLIVAEEMPKNTSSWFVARCLEMLPSPRVLISYADSDFGHVGYIYQATNWIYTGESEGRRIYMKDGREYHRKTVYDMLGKHDLADAERAGFVYHKGKPKHRYFMFLGTKKQKKEMRELLQFPVLPYPKGITKRYEASQTIVTQGMLL